MNLEELLDHARGYLDDVSDISAGDPDLLWSDELLVRYLNEAQRILCRRSWVIIETGIAPAGVITLATDKVLYSLHKSVLRVFDATPTTQSAALGRGNDFDLRNPYLLSMDAFDIGVAASLAGIALPAAGAPEAIASDAGTRALRVFPPPAAAQNGLQIMLKIARMPVCFLDVNKMTGTPEVPEEYHLWLTDYAAGRCLKQANLDSVAKALGQELLDDFALHVREARQDRQRASLGNDRWVFSSVTAAL